MTFEVIAGWREAAAGGTILIVVWASALAAFEAYWDRSALVDIGAQWGGWVGAVGVIAASAAIHELLHMGAWRLFGGLPSRAIAFRRTAQVMGIAARVVLPTPLGAYRVGLAMPFALMGLLPMVLGIMTGKGLLVAWALFFSLESFSDLVALVATRSLSASLPVLSHPTKSGVVCEAAT